MKIAVITDTHFGVRNDNQVLLRHQEKFFEETFFPTLESEKIKEIWHLGDLVDRRKYINFDTCNRMKKCFLDRTNRMNVHIIAGNHDVYYKNSNRINALDELVAGQYNHISIYTEPTTVLVDQNTTALIVPWINEENQETSLRLIAESEDKYLFGHLEVFGFDMFRGSVCTHGLNRRIFDKFDKVLTGHFHEKSTQGNICYLGAPYLTTWGDFPSDRGFHTFDTLTGDLTYFKNPESLFKMIVYNDTVDQANIRDINLKDCFVKVVVEQKTNPYKFDLFLTEIDNQQPADLRIIESFSYNDEGSSTMDAQDTPTIIDNTIDNIEVTCDKTRLKARMKQLYNTAMVSEKESIE